MTPKELVGRLRIRYENLNFQPPLPGDCDPQLDSSYVIRIRFLYFLILNKSTSPSLH